jgi:hypothetical protein
LQWNYDTLGNKGEMHASVNETLFVYQSRSAIPPFLLSCGRSRGYLDDRELEILPSSAHRFLDQQVNFPTHTSKFWSSGSTPQATVDPQEL